MELAELLEMEKEVLAKEYEAKIKNLTDELETPVIGDSAWIKEATSVKDMETIKKVILYPFRDELEGRYVYYADGFNGRWRFNTKEMRTWLAKNFSRIDWKVK